MIYDPLKADNAFVDPGQGRNVMILGKPSSGKSTVNIDLWRKYTAVATRNASLKRLPGHSSSKGGK